MKSRVERRKKFTIRVFSSLDKPAYSFIRVSIPCSSLSQHGESPALVVRQGLRQGFDVGHGGLRAEADAEGAGGGALVYGHGREDVAGPASPPAPPATGAGQIGRAHV